ncbi:hypothetical protein KY290_035212 [Solanum tuberosum]|uniref:Uncharacterized protein n=1 Tax=Solanum tuberosum TaxID=4113 RepID=A0ABQ7U6G0_SOLTU|nr:hypothetical protein KY289_033034 [Solanum tuberosum]KAH0644710.1 hypothetical protein KY284_032594 [Solanum tuberosum]KAH0647679.1 hypothetical protein KY285_032927 [Solanum tuberosum]KAH0742169.1 hypothetical protein KY290_035212 [Solanum tuberosum]
MHDILSLVVPSFITKLCNRAEVEVLSGETLMHPNNPIFPLKMCGEGMVVKSKKRKVDSRKSIHVDDDSPAPPIVVPFESLESESCIVKEIVTRKQKAQLINLEKAYAGLAKSHGALSIIHSKMKKREKSRDKFFTQMWKRVKCLWKVLKATEPPQISRPDGDGDGDEPDTWSDDGGDEDSEATDTDGEN